MAASTGLDERESDAWRAFLEAQRRVIDALDSFTKRSTGIAVEDYEVLMQLAEAPERRLRMRDLANRLCFSPSRLSHRIDRLSELGFVDREPVPGDRRGTYATLTDYGRELVERHSQAHVEAVRSLLFDKLDDAEIDAMRGALTRVADSLR